MSIKTANTVLHLFRKAVYMFKAWKRLSPRVVDVYAVPYGLEATRKAYHIDTDTVLIP